jgi:hypothetical protein
MTILRSGLSIFFTNTFKKYVYELYKLINVSKVDEES